MAGAFQVRIRLESRIENLDSHGLVDGDVENTVEEAVGDLIESDGGYTLSFNQSGEDGELYSEIICASESVRVVRRGRVSSDFLFVEGEEQKSIYAVGPYQFEVRIKTERVGYDLNGPSGTVSVLYRMNIGGADKAVRMKIWIQAS